MSLADAQLAAWEAIAEDWDMRADGSCGECGKGIALLSDRHGKPYRLSYADLLALTVLHLRNFHSDLDPDRPPHAL